MTTAEQVEAIEISKNLADRARLYAKNAGMPLEQWIEEAVFGRVATEDETTAFFRSRARRADPARIQEILDKIPDNPPDPGDEW